MTVQAGTIKGIVLLKEPYIGGGYNAAEVFATWPAYGATADSGILSNVATAIQNSRRDGKTVTLEYSMPCQAGNDGAQDVYLGLTTVSSGDLTGNLQDIDKTELSTAAMTRAGSLVVVYKLV